MLTLKLTASPISTAPSPKSPKGLGLGTVTRSQTPAHWLLHKAPCGHCSQHRLPGGSGQTNQLPCPKLKGPFVWGCPLGPHRARREAVSSTVAQGPWGRVRGREWGGSPKPAAL